MWFLMGGEYREDENLFMADIPLLPGRGRTVALFLLPETSTTEKGQGYLSAPAQQNVQFQAECSGFGGSDIDCSQGIRSAVENELVDAYNTYSGLGFPDPILDRLEDGTYVVELRPYYESSDADNDSAMCELEQNPNAFNPSGVYILLPTKLVICIPADGATESVLDVTRHELFHAIQHAFIQVRFNNGEDWIIEGTAEAAINSSNTMTRRDAQDLRVMDVSLVETDPEPYEYDTQDFWVYLGREWGLGLDFLIDLFERGAFRNHVDAAMQEDWPGGMTLGDAYWKFARSQVYEYNVTIEDNPVTGRDICEWDLDVISSEEIVYRYPSPPDDHTFTLEPLSSKFFKLNYKSMPNAAYTAGYEVSAGGGSDVRAISYPGGVSPCSNIQPASNEVINIGAGEDTAYFLLVSNTSMDAARDITLSFLPDEAGVEIIEPEDGLTYDEGTTINFLAMASGMMGDNPSTFQLQWSYSTPDRDTINMGHAENGQYFPYDNLCDGVYQVTATGRNASTGQNASDTIQVIVNDLGNSNPPPQCAPDVEIVSPGQNAKFKVGDTIQLEAVIDDDHPETEDPLYPVTWHANDASGAILGRGLKASTKLGEGVNYLYVSYGAASDRQEISVIDTPNQDPEAVIDQPAMDESFSYADPSAGLTSYTVTFKGHGEDEEDGSLPASSLHWLVREMGSSSWENIGTGTQVSHAFRYQTGITWYVVRLEVYDSEGLMGSMEVEFSIQAPPS